MPPLKCDVIITPPGANVLKMFLLQNLPNIAAGAAILHLPHREASLTLAESDVARLEVEHEDPEGQRSPTQFRRGATSAVRLPSKGPVPL